MRCMLAFSYHTIVTTAAGASNRIVIKARQRQPASVAMTIIADIRRKHMRGVLAIGYSAIMATEAITTNTSMIIYGASPAKCAVAIVANITTLNMPRMFTGCGHAIMTTLTTTGNRKMINPHNILPGAT